MSKKRISKKVNSVVKNYLSLLKQDNFLVQQVFIFGSRVNGRARGDSDLDIAIVSDQIKDDFQGNLYLLKKAHQLPDSMFIEPHGFHPKNFINESPLVWEIKKNGIRMK